MLQNTGLDNIVLFKFFIYKTDDYELLDEEMKQKHYLIKRYDEYGYCLVYETMPAYANMTDKEWEEYVKIYNSLPIIIENIKINKEVV